MEQKNTEQTKELETIIKSIEAKYAPDKRLELFNIKGEVSEDEIVLKGETTSEAAYIELLSEVSKMRINLKDSIRVLPNKDLGEKQWGVANHSVSDLRFHPTHTSELVTQVLLGMPVKLLNRKNDWLQAQTPEGYIGWITKGSLHLLTKKELNDYLKKPKIIVTNHYALSFSEPTSNAEPVSDIVIGNMLVIKNTLSDYYSVNYPDGRQAYILKQDACMVYEWLSKIEITQNSIVSTAKQFMGIPYVWGGTSSKGIDCSGFIKLVFFLHGIITMRDASQQVKHGTEIDSIGNFDALQKGDLVFFGEKITEKRLDEKVVHVGIYIGNKRFIHASENVHISSFDPNDSLYDEFNTNRYLRTMRYIGYEGSSGIETITTNPFFLSLK